MSPPQMTTTMMLMADREVSGCVRVGNTTTNTKQQPQQEETRPLSRSRRQAELLLDHDKKTNNTNSKVLYRENEQLLSPLGTTSVVPPQYHDWLPLIVAVGATSSAKSSVLANLSGIELPASSTLTTRCPILLQMQTTTTTTTTSTEKSTSTPRSRRPRRTAHVQVVWKSSSSHPPFEAHIIDDGDDDNDLKQQEHQGVEEEDSKSSNDDHHQTWDTRVPKAIARAQQHILQHTKKEVARDMVSVSITTTTTIQQQQPRSSGSSSSGGRSTALAAGGGERPDDCLFQDDSTATATNPTNPTSTKGSCDSNNRDDHKTGSCHDYDTLSSSTSSSSSLTLLDLPGWVSSKAEHESETLVEDVQSLITEYLTTRTTQSNNRKKKGCVILAILPANVDFHNNPVLAQVTKLVENNTNNNSNDPGRIHLIPVITKPDLIDPGAEHDVVELLMGQTLTLFEEYGGFHMIKARGQAALDAGVTIQQGLEDERRFFDQVEPWKSIENRALFGTLQLRQKLVALERQLLLESLPDVLAELRQKQPAIVQALGLMGQKQIPSNSFERRRYYQELCDKLISKIKSSSTGKGRATTPVRTTLKMTTQPEQPSPKNQPSAAANLHEAVAHFCQKIRNASLATVSTIAEGVRVLVTSPRGCICGEVVHLEGGGGSFACVDFVHSADAQSDVLFEQVGRQILKEEEDPIEENEVYSDGSRVCIARKGNAFDVMRQIPLANIRTDPTWLQQKIADNRTDDLACFLNIDVFKSIVANFIEEEWKEHCLSLIDSMRRLLLQAVEDSIQQTFAAKNHRYPELFLLVDQHCRAVVQDLAANALQQALANLETEKHPYTSLHDDLCQQIASERHSRLKRELEVSLRLDQRNGIYDTEAIKAIVDSVFDRNQQKSVEEHMAEEMELVLAAYGAVATKRVLDRIPMICWGVFRVLGSSIQQSLWAITDETLQQCMQESQEFALRHSQLEAELEELNHSIHYFESIV